MGELLDLLDAGPMIALAIACVLMVSVVVVVILQARRISRLEDRLAERGEAADDAPLRRIAELQARNELSEGGQSAGGGTFPLRQVLAIAGTAVVLVLGIVGVYFFVTGGDDGAGGAQAATTGRTDAASTRAARTTPGPRASSTVPAEIPPLEDAASHTVAVFNASGVSGAAAGGANRLQVEGFQVPITDDYPGVTNLAQSVVMYSTEDDRVTAWNVADLLGIDRAPALEGLTPDQTGGADVVVVVGLDTAQGLANGATTTTP